MRGAHIRALPRDPRIKEIQENDMTEIELIEVVENTAEQLRGVAGHPVWMPRDALEHVIELRVISRMLVERISGRKPGWCPVLDGWTNVINLACLSVERLVENLQDPTRGDRDRSIKSVMSITKRADTAIRRHRKRPGVGSGAE